MAKKPILSQAKGAALGGNPLLRRRIRAARRVRLLEAVLYQHGEISKLRRPLQAVAARADARQEGERAERDGRHVGDPVSMIEIPRIGVSAAVVEGVAPPDLRIAAGHVPGTAFPGEIGKVGIGAHRDTFFRNLRYIRQADAIVLTTRSTCYHYLVESTAIVDPRDVQELQNSTQSILTLVTCHPFYFVGPAPQRFIVRARQVGPYSGN
jgi:LPXTG-site transpeptidase (sortase) family protein